MPSHFSRIFRKVMGLSYQEYLNGRRITKAKKPPPYQPPKRSRNRHLPRFCRSNRLRQNFQEADQPDAFRLQKPAPKLIFLQKKHKKPRACHKKPRQERLTSASFVPYESEPDLEVGKFPYCPDRMRIQARVPVTAPLRPVSGRGPLRAGDDGEGQRAPPRSPRRRGTKKNPPSQTTATIGVPFTYTITAPLLGNLDSSGSFHCTNAADDATVTNVIVTDDLTTTGASLTYVTNRRLPGEFGYRRKNADKRRSTA